MVGGDVGEVGIPASRSHLSGLLVQHDIIHLRTERIGNRVGIGGKGIRRDLWSVDDTPSHIGHKGLGVLSRPFPDQIADNQLGMGIEREPEVRIPELGWIMLLDMVLLLVDE